MWGGIGGTGFTTATRRWHGLRLCMVIVPQHTDIYIYIIVCEALMCCCCCRCRCRLVVSVCVFWVWGVVVHTPGIAVCAAAAAALLAAPLHQEARLCIWHWHALNSIMPCLCVDDTLISGVCVCLAHTHPRHPRLSRHPHAHCI